MKWAGFISLIVGGLTAAPSSSAGGEPVGPLSLDSYIALAKKKNPQVQIAYSAVRTAIAKRKTAVSLLLPHVGAQAQADRAESIVPSLNTTATGSAYDAGVSASQLIFDFGKSWFSSGAASRLVDAAAQDAKGSVQTVVVNAATAYFNYLLSQRLLAVAREARAQEQAHLEEAQVLFETGKQAKYTVVKAEADLASAEVALITAKNGVRLAKVQMDVAAGATLPDSLVLTDSLEAPEQDISLIEALARAQEARPELVSSRAQLRAADLQVTSAKMTLFPQLNASAGYGYQRTDVSDWQSNWSVGITLSATLYEGGLLAAAVDQAQAARDQAKAQLDANVQSVQAEVEQDYFEKMEAAERIVATRKLIEQTQEDLRLSQERFAAGAAASLEVTDAEVTLANAKSSYAQALCDYRTAHAKLLAAIGTL
jgi:outer membrane protein TolC